MMIVLKKNRFHGSMNLFVLLLQRNKSYFQLHGTIGRNHRLKPTRMVPGLRKSYSCGGTFDQVFISTSVSASTVNSIRCPSLVNSIRFLPVILASAGVTIIQDTVAPCPPSATGRLLPDGLSYLISRCGRLSSRCWQTHSTGLLPPPSVSSTRKYG